LDIFSYLLDCTKELVSDTTVLKSLQYLPSSNRAPSKGNLKPRVPSAATEATPPTVPPTARAVPLAPPAVTQLKIPAAAHPAGPKKNADA
jgi:hypothetical protein